MRSTVCQFLLVMALLGGVWHVTTSSVAAQARAPEALGGLVSSQEEAKMEGVVVTARREGSNIAVSVVSDAQGHYSIPRTHLDPGKYTLTIRAVGYDLSAPTSVDVAAATAATKDLALRKTPKPLCAAELRRVDHERRRH